MTWCAPTVPTHRTKRFHRFDFVVTGAWFVVLVQSTETTDVTTTAWMQRTRDMETEMSAKLVECGIASMEDVLAFWGLHATAHSRLVSVPNDGWASAKFECPSYARRFLRQPYKPTVIVLEGVDAVVPFILNMGTCTFRALVPHAAWHKVGKQAPPEASQRFDDLVHRAWKVYLRSPSVSPSSSPMSPSPLGSFCGGITGSISPPVTPRARRSATALRAGGSSRQRRRRMTNDDLRPGAADNEDLISPRSSTDPEDMVFRLEIDVGGSE